MPVQIWEWTIHLCAFVSVLYSVTVLIKKWKEKIDIIKFKIVMLCAEVELQFSLGQAGLLKLTGYPKTKRRPLCAETWHNSSGFCSLHILLAYFFIVSRLKFIHGGLSPRH